MANSKLIIAGLISAVCISGCATAPTTIGVENRAAIETAMDKQIVSTEAVEGAPVLHPAMSAAAIDRYLTDSVKEPEISGGFAPGG